MNSAVILWPIARLFGVYELDFAVKFCLSKTRELTGLPVITYNPNKPIRDFLSNLSGIKRLIVVTEPLSIVSSYARDLLLQDVSSSSVIGAVYNESKNQLQVARLDVPYLDIYTFEEVACMLARKGELKCADSIDAACFSCSYDLLVENQDVRACEIPLVVPNRFCHTGALVHRFVGLFSSERRDLVELVPDGIETVLDVGCAEGGFGKSLINRNPRVLVDGVEMNSVLAQKASGFYRKVYIGKFEDVELPEQFYDVVNMGEVLEHMYDPWFAIKKVKMLLKPGGYFVGCVPNMSHWTVVRQLISGMFEYVPVGLLCVSHIRFFTMTSLKKLFDEFGFYIDILRPLEFPLTPDGEKFISALSELRLPYFDKEALTTVEIFFRVRRV